MPSDHPADRRLHPLSILFNLFAEARRFALPGIFFLVTAASRGWAGWGWELWALPLLIPYAFVATVRYASFRYRYEANEIVIRSGLFFRNERHVPYSRIQNLDAVQNVFHRLFDVVEVRLETGGGKEPEAKMSVLPVAAFEEMRRRVFERSAAPVEETEGSPAAGRTLLSLKPLEVVLCGFLQNRGALVIGAGFGLLWEIGMFDRFAEGAFGKEVSGRGVARDLLRSLWGGLWDGLGGGLWGLLEELPLGRIGFTLAAIAALLVLLRLISMVWAFFQLYGFRLTLAGEDLRTEYGLLTRVVTTIPLRRLQTLTIHEGLFHRLFERASVRVDTAGADGGEENKSQREWLAPIVHRSELPGLVHAVMPGLDLAAVTWTPAPPRAFRRELKGWILLVLGMSVPLALALKGWALVPIAMLLAWAFVAARRTVAHLGWAVTDGAVLFRSGWLWRKVSVAPFAKIQAVAVHESPFDRRAAMARVKVDTAGTRETSHGVDIPYLPKETALGLRDLLAAQAAQTAFRW